MLFGISAGNHGIREDLVKGVGGVIIDDLHDTLIKGFSDPGITGTIKIGAFRLQPYDKRSKEIGTSEKTSDN